MGKDGNQMIDSTRNCSIKSMSNLSNLEHTLKLISPSLFLRNMLQKLLALAEKRFLLQSTRPLAFLFTETFSLVLAFKFGGEIQLVG